MLSGGVWVTSGGGETGQEAGLSFLSLCLSQRLSVLTREPNTAMPQWGALGTFRSLCLAITPLALGFLWGTEKDSGLSVVSCPAQPGAWVPEDE